MSSRKGGYSGVITAVVGHDPEHPAVEAEHQVEDRARIAAADQQRHGRHQHQQADQAVPDPTAEPGDPADHAPAHEDPGDQVLGKAGDPPSDQRQALALMLWIGDLETGRVIRLVGQGERWVEVGAVRGVGVEGDPPGPAHDPEVEVEETARVATAAGDDDEGRRGGDRERRPEQDEDEEMRQREQPLEHPQPPRRLLEPPFDADRIRGDRWGAFALHGFLRWSELGRGRHCTHVHVHLSSERDSLLPWRR
jgi:hypothetical protein